MIHLQTLAVGQELAHVVGIAMSQLGSPESLTVVIDSHRAVHHLVKAIAVQVGGVERVVALSGVGTIGVAVLALAALPGVEAPPLRQLSVAVVPCLQDRTCIDAAPYYHRGQARLVETAHAHAERAGPLPVAVAPGLAGFAVDEVVAGQFAPRLSVDDGEELRPGRVVMIHPSGAAAVLVAPRAIVYLAVAVGIGNSLAVAEHRAFAGADSHFSTAVTVEVGHGEGRAVA